METHLTHLEDLAIERGKQGFESFVDTVSLFLKKIQGQDSELEINAKIDGSPALLFGKDPRDKYLNQFFISLKHGFDSLKGELKETAKIIHSEKDINLFYGSRPSFANKLSILFKELNRAYDNSGNVYQCDVLFAGGEDKVIQRIDGEDYITFKPNVIMYAIPADVSSNLYNEINNSEIGIVVHDSFSAQKNDNSIRLRQKSRKVDSIVKSGKRAGVFVMGSNFSQAKVDVDGNTILKINSLLGECSQLIPLISDGFNNEYVGSQVMEYLKIYINKQIDLPKGGIFSKKMKQADIKNFIKGFKKFIENRFKLIIDKKKTERGRTGQKEKLNNLLSFLNMHQESLLYLLTLFTKMIEIKKIILILTSKLTDDLRRTFFNGPDGILVPSKGEGHVLFNGGTHVKIVDRLEFTKINRKSGGIRQ
jgi:hypothetical protein